jgi:ABC-2 type transport system permease protein
VSAATAVAVVPRSTAYVGTTTLLRAGLRRDRRRLLIWVLSLGLLTVYAVVGLSTIYDTPASRQSRAAVIETPAGIMLGGPGYGTENYTIGAMIANELGLSVMVAMAIMSLLLVVRHTRAEEDDGRADLLLSCTVGRRAPLLATLLLMGAANLAVGVVVFAGLAGSGLAAVDSLALAAGWALTGAVFGCVAAVTAQAMAQARAASGTALAVLGAAAVVRGIGDILTEHGSALSWLSPIAWAQQTRAFVDLRWWPLLLSVALIGVLTAVAFALDDRRDVGAGLVAPRRGPGAAAPSLAGPTALVARLQRGTVVGWPAPLLLLGLTFGSLSDSVTGMVGDIPQLQRALAVGDDPIDSFAAAAAMYFGLLAASYAVASVLRLRGEESAGRVELLLATALDRRRLLGATLGLTAVVATLLLVVGGLADGLAAAAVLDDAGRIGPQLGAALVQLPAVLVVIGLATALVGAAPRSASLAWLVVVWALLAGIFGPLLNLPEWAVKLSPFGWVPRVPAEDLDVVPLVGLVVVAVVLITVGLIGFRRRDVPA